MYVERRAVAPLFWTNLCSTPNSAKKIGIWISSGRQPASGLTPCSLNSGICSWLCFCRSSGYFFFSSAILGCSSCISRWLLICFMNSGNSSSRMQTVSRTIDRPQVHPAVVRCVSPEWIVDRIQATAR